MMATVRRHQVSTQRCRHPTTQHRLPGGPYLLEAGSVESGDSLHGGDLWRGHDRDV